MYGLDTIDFVDFHDYHFDDDPLPGAPRVVEPGTPDSGGARLAASGTVDDGTLASTFVSGAQTGKAAADGRRRA